MKINLVLSGGAARGAFHLGVLQAMQELDIKIEAISGSSIGALIGISYASGLKPKEILEIFKNKETKEAVKFNFFRKSLFSIDTTSVVTQKLFPIKNLEDLPVKAYITVIDLKSGKILRYDRGDIVSLCIATSALIPVFKPIQYDDRILADGGMMDNLPIEPFLNSSLPVIGVDLHPLQENHKNSFFGNIKRAMFLVWRASVQKNIDQFDLYVTDLELTKYNIFSFKKLDNMFELGYQKAHTLLREYAKNKKK